MTGLQKLVTDSFLLAASPSGSAGATWQGLEGSPVEELTLPTTSEVLLHCKLEVAKVSWTS